MNRRATSSMPRPVSTSPAKRPRGRPPAFDRDRAVAAALALFLERGYGGTSVADLVAAMGITPSSLYAAFESKEGLYREALQRYVEGRGRFVGRALEQRVPVREQVRQMLYDAATTFTPLGEDTPGCMVSGDLIMCTPDSAAVADHVRALRAAPVNFVAARIDEAKRDGELPRSVDAAALARFYAAVVTGMAVQARDGAPRKVLLAIAEHALAAWPANPRAGSAKAESTASRKRASARR